jgi:hypothetical protein
MKGWIIAHSPDLVEPGERAFVEQLGDPEPTRLTYSSLMSSEDCETIDAGAYHDARSWFTNHDEGETLVDGVSLGRAFEYDATETLIRHRRAALVLSRLPADSADKTFRLRGVGDEWWTMARALGAEPIAEGPGVVPPRISGADPTPPSRSCRLEARLAGVLAPRKPWLVLMGSPTWARQYQHHLLHRASGQLVDPGRRILLDAIRQRARIESIWLADLVKQHRPPTLSDAAFDSPELGALKAVQNRFRLLQPSLAAWAAAGRRVGRSGVVAVVGQDALPPQRAFVLGLRAAGGRAITLEHGISGSYTEQVSSVANALAVWGEPQVAYHRTAGPPGLHVVAVGWPRLESTNLAPPAGDNGWDLIHFSQPSEDLSAGGWPEAHIRAVQMVEEYARIHPDRRVAIKLHPASRTLGFAPPLVRHAHMVSGDSLTLLRSSRVVLVTRSTTGIEAMCLGRPVLQVPPRGYLGPTEFIGGSGAAIQVDSVEQLVVTTERLLSDRLAYGDAIERGRAYASSFIRGLGETGGAVRRLAELVAELRSS